jgi:hypothetical protein
LFVLSLVQFVNLQQPLSSGVIQKSRQIVTSGLLFYARFASLPCLDALLSHTNDIAAIFILDRVPVRIITNHNQRTAERGRINAFHLVAFMSSLANQPLAFQFQLRDPESARAPAHMPTPNITIRIRFKATSFAG